MKLALGLDLYRGVRPTVPVDTVRLAERLGFHSVWTAEAYGCDALSPLAYLAALTDRIGLATGVVQIAARTPAATAMHAMTIDALARQRTGDYDAPSRVMIGLGVSGPQIVEGWYGMPWGVPHQRLREYVAIMRRVFAREPLVNEGTEYPLPYRGAGSTGTGKALRSIVHPSPGIGIWIAAGGPMNTALAGEVADGFLPMGWGVNGDEVFGPSLRDGFARRNHPATAADFDVFAGCQVVITDDVAAALDALRPLTAMYVGGMGSASHNYHRAAMARRGFPSEAARIQELWLAGRRDEAIATVPDEYLDDGGLYGSAARVRQRWPSWTARGLSGLTIRADQHEALELVADLAGSRDTDKG